MLGDAHPGWPPARPNLDAGDIGTLVSQRLKLPGMCWNISGATGILTLRCQQASDRWEQIWARPNNQTATATTA